MTLDLVVKEALALSPDERAQLADKMWQSLRCREQELQLTPAQREDLLRRIAEDDAGRSDPQEWEAFRNSLRRPKA